MFRSAAILVLLTILLAFASPISQPALPTLIQQEGDLEQQAKGFIDLLVRGQFAEAGQNFTPEMQAALPPGRLNSVWADVIKKYGPYEGIQDIQIESVETFTAVNIHARFEKALINLRVVFDQENRIAGFFYSPLEATGSLSVGFLISLAVSALLVIIYPFLLAWLVRRRYHVSWRFFAFGSGIFILFQLMTRIPMVQVIQSILAPQLSSSKALQVVWLIALSLSAGLFEEIGRYVGYRWIMPKEQKRWGEGVMYGLGHGGIEAVILVGITQLITLGLLVFSPMLSGILPAEIQGLLVGQTAALAGSPSWLPFLAAWERLWTVLFHVALSLVVLQVFRRGQIRWLWLAIALHTFANVLVVVIPRFLSLPELASKVLSEALVGIIGIFALWIIWHFKRLMDYDEDRSG